MQGSLYVGQRRPWIRLVRSVLCNHPNLHSRHVRNKYYWRIRFKKGFDSDFASCLSVSNLITIEMSMVVNR